MLSVISEGTVEDSREAKKLETCKCSDFQNGNRQQPASFRLENVMSLSSKVLKQIVKGHLRAPKIESDVFLEPVSGNRE